MRSAVAARLRLVPVVCLLILVACERRAEPGDWRVYGADKANTKYSPLDQITADNVSQLEVAWRWASIDQPILDADTSLWTGQNEATPLAVDGIRRSAFHHSFFFPILSFS